MFSSKKFNKMNSSKNFVLDRFVFIYVTLVYATLCLNKPQMGMRDKGEIPWPFYT